MNWKENMPWYTPTKNSQKIWSARQIQSIHWVGVQRRQWYQRRNPGEINGWSEGAHARCAGVQRVFRTVSPQAPHYWKLPHLKIHPKPLQMHFYGPPARGCIELPFGCRSKRRWVLGMETWWMVILWACNLPRPLYKRSWKHPGHSGEYSSSVSDIPACLQ